MGLSNAMSTGVTGLSAFGTALSVVSDNVANADTTAWKSNSVQFGDLVSGYYTTQGYEMEAQGVGASLLGITNDQTVGPSVSTGAWSNVMIQGSGYFKVENSSGSTFYTRDGTFSLDKDGNLVNLQGYQVVGTAADGSTGPLKVDDPSNPAYMGYEINSAGEIYGSPVDGGAKELIGTLTVSTFPNPDGLIRSGSNLYIQGAAAGTAVDSTGGVGQAGQVIAGAVEGSNVDIAKEMVNMIIYQSDYTANSKSIHTASNMLDTVVNLIR
jgi:flagellar hook protein FlgE